jgi:hypothetical protein
MMWYEIPGFPGYRLNHLEEVMSTKGLEPLIMKTWDVNGTQWVMLRKDGEYVHCRIESLMARTFPSKEDVPKPHHEAVRDKCDNGHRFTASNTLARKSRGRTIRQCRSCRNLAMRRYRININAREPRPPTE